MDRLHVALRQGNAPQTLGVPPPHRRRIGFLTEAWRSLCRLAALRELVRGKRGRKRGHQERVAARNGRAAVELPTYLPPSRGRQRTDTHTIGPPAQRNASSSDGIH